MSEWGVGVGVGSGVRYGCCRVEWGVRLSEWGFGVGSGVRVRFSRVQDQRAALT